MSISVPAWPTAAVRSLSKSKSLRIRASHVTGSVIPQKMIELIDRVGKIGIAFAINNIDSLVGVQMKSSKRCSGAGASAVAI